MNFDATEKCTTRKNNWMVFANGKRKKTEGSDKRRNSTDMQSGEHEQDEKWYKCYFCS